MKGHHWPMKGMPALHATHGTSSVRSAGAPTPWVYDEQSEIWTKRWHVSFSSIGYDDALGCFRPITWACFSIQWPLWYNQDNCTICEEKWRWFYHDELITPCSPATPLRHGGEAGNSWVYDGTIGVLTRRWHCTYRAMWWDKDREAERPVTWQCISVKFPVKDNKEACFVAEEQWKWSYND